MIDFKALAAPFPPDRISWRVGSTNKDKTKGMALAFIDARDVMERLDTVCGPENWQNRYPHANGKTVCDIGIKCGDELVWKADGAGDTDVEAEKGALSDAFKRAAVRWGIGRYLYDLASPWVSLEAAGRSFKIAESEMPKLRALLAKDAKQGAPAAQLPTAQTPADDGPRPRLPMQPPSPVAEQKIWQEFAKAAVRLAEWTETVDDFDQWRMDNKAALEAIKARSATLYEWLNKQLNAHCEKLQRKAA